MVTLILNSKGMLQWEVKGRLQSADSVLLQPSCQFRTQTQDQQLLYAAFPCVAYIYRAAYIVKRFNKNVESSKLTCCEWISENELETDMVVGCGLWSCCWFGRSCRTSHNYFYLFYEQGAADVEKGGKGTGTGTGPHGLNERYHYILRTRAARVSSATTLCLLITALLVMTVGLFGGLYIYRQMTRARVSISILSELCRHISYIYFSVAVSGASTIIKMYVWFPGSSLFRSGRMLVGLGLGYYLDEI